MDESPGALDPGTLFRRPDVFPLEFGQGALDMVPMSRESYLRSLFLDRRRIVPAARRGWRLPLPGLLGEFERRGGARLPVNFIFHIAHCGSTLLARAMDLPGRTLVLREPFTLRQLGAEAAATAAGPRDPDAWSRILALTTGLLGRRYEETEAVIVKANVPVNFILAPLMALHPESRGLLLYAGLERYVLSVMKTPMHRNWVDNVSSHLAGGILSSSELAETDLGKLSTAQRAACLWAAQILRFRDAMAADTRLRSLDCERLFATPGETLARCFEHFGVDVPDNVPAEIAAGELFSHHAKNPGLAYDREQREQDLERLRAELADDLEQARSWIEGKGLAGLVLPVTGAL